MEETLEHLGGWDLFKALLSKSEGNLEKLIDLADQNADVMQYCLDPSLNSIWEEAWSKMNTLPTYLECESDPNLRYRPLVPQPNLHPFYRLAGISFFNRGKPGNRELLVKAANAPYNSFHALKVLSEEYVAQVKKGQGVAAFALLNARSASRVHHAPGFILLAEIYMDLALYVKKNASVQADTFYCEAFKNLVIADTLEPYCQAGLHNAYYGLGPSVSNGLGLNSAKELLENLQSCLMKNKNSRFDFTGLREEAFAVAQEIIDRCYRQNKCEERLSKKVKILEGVDTKGYSFLG